MGSRSPRHRSRLAGIAVRLLPWLVAAVAHAEVPPDSIRVLYQHGRAEPAEVLVRAALAQPFATTHADSSRRAVWQDLLAEAQWRLWRRGPAADSIADAALTYRRRLNGPDSEPVALSLATQARVWRYTRSADSSVAGLKRALALMQRVAPGSRPAIADMLVSLGNALREARAYDDAVVALEQAVALRRAALGPDHRDVARGLINLGLAYGSTGRGQRRIAAEREACDILARALPLDSLALYVTSRNLAGSLFTQHRFLEAGPYVARCLELGEHLNAPGSLDRALDEENAGNYQVATGERASAREHFDIALAIYNAHGRGESPFAEARYWLNRSSLEEQDGRLDSALACARRGTEGFERMFRASHAATQGSAWAAGLERWAQVACVAGRLADAAHAFDAAATLYRTHQGGDAPDVAYTLSELAKVRLRMGRTDSVAAPALEAARALTRHVRREFTNMSEEEALRSRTRGARGALHTLLSLACLDPRHAPLDELWDALVRDEGSVADALCARRDLLAASGDSTLAEQVSALVRARTKLADAELRAGADPEQVALRNTVRALEQRLAGESDRLAADFARQEFGALDLATALPSRATLVRYVRFPRSGPGDPPGAFAADAALEAWPSAGPTQYWYAAFVLRGGETHPHFLSLGPASAVEPALATWQTALAGGKRVSRAELVAGGRLRGALWDRVAPLTTGAELVLISPDGPLALLPFATLPAVDGRPLLEAGPALHVLDDLHAVVPSALPAQGARALLLGGADYGTEPGTVDVNAASGPPDSPVRGRSSRCADIGLPAFDALPGTVAELHDVAGIWRAARGSEPEVLTGTGASESAVRARVAGCWLVHLATHGFFVPDSCAQGAMQPRLLFSDLRWAPLPPGPGEVMLRSGVVLAGANSRRRSAEDDGVVTAADLAMLDLSAARLVVLSACESGQGAVLEAEGVLGIRSALRQAGARATLTSLNRVSDETTARWMTLFYARWLRDGLALPAAAREATRALRHEMLARGEGERPGAWGAFLVSGDWR